MASKQTLPWPQTLTLGLAVSLLMVPAGAPPAWARPAVTPPATSQAREPLSPQALPNLLEAARVEAQGVLRAKLNEMLSRSSKLWDKAVTQTIGQDKAWQELEKTAFRDALATSWVRELDGAISTLGSQLDTSRLTISDLADEDSNLSALYGALHSHQDTVLANLRTWVRREVPQRLAGTDPSAAKAKSTSATTLAALADDLTTKFAALWSFSIHDVVAKFQGPAGQKSAAQMMTDEETDETAGMTADNPAAADPEAPGQGDQQGADNNGSEGESQLAAELRDRTERIQKQAEEDYFHDLQKATGFSRIVRCLYAGSAKKPASLICAPGLLVNAADIAEIVVRGLPTDRDVAVTAVASEDQSGSNPKKTLQSMELVAGESICPKHTDTDGHNYPEKLASVTDPSCDEITLPVGASDTVFVSVYKNRRLFPKYGTYTGRQGSARAAFAKLRLPPLTVTATGSSPAAARHRLNLSVLISGGAAQVLVCVAPRKDSKEDGPRPACSSIPVGYQRWSVETGGFLAFSKITDKKVITQPAEDTSKVQVLEITEDGNFAQETGLWLSFVPRNYPGYGLGLGIVSDTARPISVYFGPSFRLRTFGQRGLASLSAGLALRSVDRFPALEDCLSHRNEQSCGHGFALTGKDGDSDRVLTLPEQSPLLTATQEYHTNWFVAIQLGFSFGPIPGPPDSE